MMSRLLKIISTTSLLTLLLPRASWSGQSLCFLDVNLAFNLEYRSESGQDVCKFQNKTAKPLKIRSLQPDCACLSGQVKGNKMEYAPGESGEIVVTYQVTDQTGRIEKKLGVLVEENGEQKEVELTVVATVPQAFTVEPANLKWEVGAEAKPQTVVVKAAEGQNLQIKSVNPSRTNLDHTTKEITPGKHYEVTITPKSTEDVQLSSVTIETTLPYPRQYKKVLSVAIMPKKPVGSP